MTISRFETVLRHYDFASRCEVVTPITLWIDDDGRIKHLPRKSAVDRRKRRIENGVPVCRNGHRLTPDMIISKGRCVICSRATNKRAYRNRK